MKKLHVFFMAIFVLGAFWLARPAQASDILYFTSTPGSWIGQGQTMTITSVTARRTGSLGAYTNTVTFDGGGYELNLVGSNNTLVGVGNYDNATRWPFNYGTPGMWFTAPGRGDNNISGWFKVYQADYNTDGTILSFAVDFKQYDETSTTNYTMGSVRYHSSVPFPVPEPSTAVLGLAALMLFGRRGRMTVRRG